MLHAGTHNALFKNCELLKNRTTAIYPLIQIQSQVLKDASGEIHYLIQPTVNMQYLPNQDLNSQSARF